MPQCIPVLNMHGFLHHLEVMSKIHVHVIQIFLCLFCRSKALLPKNVQPARKLSRTPSTTSITKESPKKAPGMQCKIDVLRVS